LFEAAGVSSSIDKQISLHFDFSLGSLNNGEKLYKKLIRGFNSHFVDYLLPMD